MAFDLFVFILIPRIVVYIRNDKTITGSSPTFRKSSPIRELDGQLGGKKEWNHNFWGNVAAK
jgi:hypothetical protein